MFTNTQKKIIETKGNLIVRASAGTGKTHTMVNKMVYELDCNTTHKCIAAITFTIKASNEIKDRIKIDVSQQYIGTINRFAIDEIISPFMKDVYGIEYSIAFDTDYSRKIRNYDEGLKLIEQEGILGSYANNKKNFIFELAKNILSKSEVCKIYFKSKYFKIYIDEYQDCDKDMHELFMYICDELNIDLFIVGDEKQSIYMWRGAYPEAFKSIWEKDNFSKIFMIDNFRSCQQIQNYTNILCDETRELYIDTDEIGNIIFMKKTDDIWQKIISNISVDKTTALLRFSNANAQKGAEELSNNGLETKYIPQIPISEITTESSWLYTNVANFCIIENYSVYSFISEIPVEGDDSRIKVKVLLKCLNAVKESCEKEDFDVFCTCFSKLAKYLNCAVKDTYFIKLYDTITDDIYHDAFETNLHKSISVTFHSSKGLEFEQVIIFTDDYRLSDEGSVYNHYVASSRAKDKLIIVYCDSYNSKKFKENFANMIKKCSPKPIQLFINIDKAS